jgi:hypothetical protein
MELEIIKGIGYLAKEYMASDFKDGFEMSIESFPCARRIIDYIVIKNENRQYWKEIKRREFVFNGSFGEWKDGWNKSDEELMDGSKI